MQERNDPLIVRLKGGLGNQFFQYSYGYSISKTYGKKLYVDTSLLKNSKRTYLLDKFLINPKVASQELVFSTLHPTLFYKLTGIKTNYLVENADSIESYLNKHSSFCIEGYWQSESFFLKYQGELRRAFTLRPQYIESIDKGLIDTLTNSTTAAFHIRRGDYLHKRDVYAALPESYYISAGEYIKQKVGNFTCVVFTDDFTWAREHFPIKGPHIFVSKYNLSDYQELHLMSLCTHNVIANSTFSWWGAWLNKNTKKIIIAPNKWFNGERCAEIVPKTWNML